MDTVIDDMIRREAQLQRFATYLMREYFTPTIQDLAAELPRLIVGYQDLPRQMQQQVIEAVKSRVQRGWSATWAQINAELPELMRQEAQFELEFYQDYAPEQLIPLRQLPDVNSTIMTLDDQAGTWAQFITRNIDDTVRQVEAIVQRGVIEGQTTDDMARQLRGTYNRRTKTYIGGVLDGKQARRAEALVRTGVSHHTNQVRDRFAQQNRDVITHRIFFATLDSRTTTICLSNHLLEWKIDDESYPRLPLHFNERSVYIFKTPGFNPLNTSRPAETGRGIDPERYNKRRNRGKEFEQISAQVTADEWLRRQPEWFVVQSLGRARADLFLQGKLPIKSMVDIANRPLTLAELRDTAAGARAFRKIGE